MWVQGVRTVDRVSELAYYGRRLTWRVGADLRCPPRGGVRHSSDRAARYPRRLSSSGRPSLRDQPTVRWPDLDRRRNILRLAGFDYSDPNHVFFVTTCARHLQQPFAD